MEKGTAGGMSLPAVSNYLFKFTKYNDFLVIYDIIVFDIRMTARIL